MKLNKDEAVTTIVIVKFLILPWQTTTHTRSKQQASYSPFPGIFFLARTLKSQAPLPSPLWSPSLCHIPCQQRWGVSLGSGNSRLALPSAHTSAFPSLHSSPLESSWPLLTFTNSARARESGHSSHLGVKVHLAYPLPPLPCRSEV